MEETPRSGPNTLVQRAAQVGAAPTPPSWKQRSTNPGRGSRDHIQHVGDDAGDLITKAYRQHGADVAADVIEAYRAAFNASRSKVGIRQVSPGEAIAHLN